MYDDTNRMYVQAMLMARYNQQYSELDNIPYRLSLFLQCLASAEDERTKQQLERAKGDIESSKKGKKIF